MSVWGNFPQNQNHPRPVAGGGLIDFIIIVDYFVSGPSEITHWQRMVHAHRSPVAQWHTLRTREECDDVFPSSTAGVS